jgi:hypothetical protein
MADDDDVKKVLANIDINKLTLAEVARFKNPAVRDALIDMLKNPGDLAASHQNHGSHADHSTSSSRFLELELLAKGGGVRGGRGGGG